MIIYHSYGKDVKKVSDFYMPTDMQYKDDLRKQRDDWTEIIEYLNNAGSSNPEIEKAQKKATRVLNRINESLQD